MHLNSGYFPSDCVPPGEPPRETRGSFSLSEKAGSSTWRELLGLLRALRTFTPVLQGHEVLLRTDSQAAVRIWHKGGSQALSETGELSIHPLILDLDNLFKDHDIRPIFQWVPRDLNELADFWSKFKDPGDWTLCDAQFRRLELRWGPHSVDRMASAENHKLPRFFSRFYAQGTEGVDCFLVQDWSTENNYVHPDPNVLSRVIEHILRCRAVGTLVIPEWPSARWPELFPHPPTRGPVRDHVILPAGCMRPAHPGTIVRDGFPPFRFWAVRVDFR